jgi:hypothetical protein
MRYLYYKGVLAVALGLAAVSMPVHAAEVSEVSKSSTEWIQELTLSNTAVPQEKGEFQLTATGSHFDFDGDGRQSKAAVEVEYGLFDRLQIGAELEYTWEKEDGESELDEFGDLEFEVLYNFVATHSFLLSASLGVAVPTGDSDGFGHGSVAYAPTLSAAYAAGSWQVFGIVGAELGSGDDSLTYGVAAARTFGDWAGIIELAGETPEEDDDDSELYAVPALAWRPHGDWEFLAGVPIGLNDESANVGIVVKVVFER